MSNLIDHAKRELETYGLGSPEADYGGALATDVLALITLFASQGHSGGSAGRVSSLFNKLSRFEPLGPLTGGDDEWMSMDGVSINIRCSRVIRTNGVAKDIQGIVWEEPNGSRYTNLHSHTAVTFPYTPTTVVKPSSEDPGRQPFTP